MALLQLQTFFYLLMSNMVSKKTILQNLPVFNNNEMLITDEQTIGDIKRNILRVHEKYASDYDGIYQFFIGKTYYDTCKNIFDFVKQNVPYSIEPGHSQRLGSPAYILNSKVDCKCYSLFCNGVLDAYRRNEGKDFNVIYRFAGYKNNGVEHVFSVFETHSKKNNFWIDPVLPTFDNRTKQPTLIKDKIVPMALYEINGIPSSNQNFNFDRSAAIRFDFPLMVEPHYVYPKTIGGGVINIGQDQQHLQDFLKVVEDSPTAWLYLFLYPIGVDTHSQWDKSKVFWLNYSEYYNMPKVVIDKQTYCNTAFFKVNGQVDNAISTGALLNSINDSITTKLGFTPKIFWSKFFGKTSAGNFGNTKASDVNPATPDQSTKLQEIGASFGLTPEQVDKITASLFGKIKIEPSIQSFAFSLNDWIGTPYPIDKNLFVAPNNPGGGGGGTLPQPNSNPTGLLKTAAIALGIKYLFFS